MVIIVYSHNILHAESYPMHTGIGLCELWTDNGVVYSDGKYGNDQRFCDFTDERLRK